MFVDFWRTLIKSLVPSTALTPTFTLVVDLPLELILHGFVARKNFIHPYIEFEL